MKRRTHHPTTDDRSSGTRPSQASGAARRADRKSLVSEARRDSTSKDRSVENERERTDQIYGVLPVLEALRAANRPIDRIVIAENVHQSRLQELYELARAARIPIRRSPRADIERIARGGNHQGVVASIGAARYLPSDELVERLSQRIRENKSPLGLVLDGVEDPRNLGAILRSAECAGVDGVFVPERRASGLTDTVSRTSAGALEYVPVARAANVARLISDLKERNIWTVAAASEADKPYTEWDWTLPSVLVLGNEGDGVRRLVRERCDAVVRIPLAGKIESLNVSVAAGVILFEAVRQRTVALSTTYKHEPESKRDRSQPR